MSFARFAKWMAPVSHRKTGASASTETVDVDLVADIYPAEAGHPTPAAGSDHHDAAKAAPVAMAPMAVMATHATTLAPAASRSLGRNERAAAMAATVAKANIVLRIMGLSWF